MLAMYWEWRLCRGNIHPSPKSVRAGTRKPPLVIPTSTAVTSICTKCGSTKRTGKHSCCARGGAWFKKCGDAGDTQFDHTWAEGIQACKRTSALSTNCCLAI